MIRDVRRSGDVFSRGERSIQNAHHLIYAHVWVLGAPDALQPSVIYASGKLAPRDDGFERLGRISGDTKFMLLLRFLKRRVVEHASDAELPVQTKNPLFFRKRAIESRAVGITVRVDLYPTPLNQGSLRSSAAVDRCVGSRRKHRPIKFAVAVASSSETIFSSPIRALIGQFKISGSFLSLPEEI